MNYDTLMIENLLALSIAVYGVMEAGVKGFVWRFIDQIGWKFNKPVDAEIYAVTFRVIGIGAGILAALVTPDVSFLRAFGFTFIDDMRWLDVISTGVMIGLGERAIHFAVDLIRDNGKILLAILAAIQKSKAKPQ